MSKCIFCNTSFFKNNKYRIFFEDRKYYAMLTNYSITVGHFLLIPKKHRSELNNMEGDIADYFETAYMLAEKVCAILQARGYTIKLNNKIFLIEENPLHIGHIHIHIIPRFGKKDAKKPKRESRKNLSLTNILLKSKF